VTERERTSPRPPEPMPMDRVGMFLGDMAAVAKNMADRNLKLWQTVSQHLRERPYTMDRLADDAARSMEVAMSNVADTWDFFRRAPERERVADVLPSALLLVSARLEAGKGSYTAPDPVWIRVPPGLGDRLPDVAEIAISGQETEATRRLEASLRAELGPSRQAYLLEVTNVNDLEAGVYSGLVFLKEPNDRPIANFRVVVEPRLGPPA
jgi:hypothetical protein